MNDPYAEGKISGNLYAQKSAVTGRLVVILDGQMPERGLALIHPISRCLKTHEIHEVILTDEPDAAPGGRVDSIAYLGFFAVEHGGVIVFGDRVFLNGACIGTLAGYDETHMPNHLNIVIKSDRLATGAAIGAGIGNTITFV